MKIRILLSTYNGEKYLREQLDSIISQTYKDWELTIRDDGSTDGTLQLLEQYCKKDSRIEIIKGQNVGVIQSFYELVKYKVADFYFFCDQDDVWFPEKIDRVAKETRKYDNTRPILYYNDLRVVDSSLSTIRERMINTVGKTPASGKLIQELLRNSVTGCASAINHVLAELWDTTDEIIMHDYFLAQIASITGDLVFIDEALQFYRQHESNVWGISTGKPQRLRSLLTGEKPVKKFWINWYEHMNQAKKLTRYKEYSSEIEWDLLRNFIGINEKNLFGRINFMRKYRLDKYVSQNKISRLLFTVLLITQMGNGGYLSRKE